MSYRFLTTRRVRQTEWIELRHGPVNFLTTDVLAELHQALREAEDDDGVRVVVLTSGLLDRYIFHFSIPELVQVGIDSRRFGLYRLFSSPVGILARWLTAVNLHLLRRWRGYERLVLALAWRFRRYVPTLRLSMQMHALYFAIENCRKTTIAAINGDCNGGGTEMGACFDFRFMVDDGGFRIGQPEVLVGILAGGGGTQRVSRLIGPAKALEFMLGCEQWTPQQAKHAGLITDHFPRANFVAKVQDYADRMSRRSPVACHATREAVRRGLDEGLCFGLAREMAGFLRCVDDVGTRAAMDEYVAVLDREVLQQATTPASIERIIAIMQGEHATRHFAPHLRQVS
jgi:enoyl-CoA hydratase/carnithine racemase